MNVFKKIVDLFSDEDEEIVDKEIEIEEKEEHKLPTFMAESIKRKETPKEQKEPEKELLKPILPKEEKEDTVVSDRELIRTNSKFTFPVAFDDTDFDVNNNIGSQNILSQERAREKEREEKKTIKEIYTKKEEKIIEPPIRFRPTPIISPVYGVLDKNYSKEDVVAKDEDNYAIPRPSKKIDFESVRKKAFGTLSDDIKENMLCDNCEILKSVREGKSIEKIREENLLTDILDDAPNDDKDVSIETAEDNYYDFGVAYEAPKKDNNAEVPDINIKNIEVTQDIKIINHNYDSEVEADKIEVKDPISRVKDSYEEELEEVKENKKDSKPLNDLELTDDLFNLIDSMYEERDD